MSIGAKSIKWLAIVSGGVLLATGCASPQVETNQTDASSQSVAEAPLPEGYATAVFAMGCFWCAESDFEKVDGVITVVSGYTGGTLENPTYEQVTYNETGHYEAVLVTYDTAKVTYEELLSVFWKNVDPFDAKGQFCDKGTSYRAAIFPQTEAETEAANASKERWTSEFERELATKIIARSTFYNAEDYHQDYYKKNPIRYRFYRNGCGRDARLEQVWGGISE